MGVEFADDIRILATSYDELGPVLETLVNALRQFYFYLNAGNLTWRKRTLQRPKEGTVLRRVCRIRKTSRSAFPDIRIRHLRWNPGFAGLVPYGVIFASCHCTLLNDLMWMFMHYSTLCLTLLRNHGPLRVGDSSGV